MIRMTTCRLALATLALTAAGCSERPAATTEAAAVPSAVAADSTAAPAAEGLATHYTCPMHPEVVTSRPGHCPKCRMALVVKE